MPLKVNLVHGKTGKDYHVASPHTDDICLVVTNYLEAHGAFKAVAITSTGVNIVSQPNNGQGIIVDSILLNARKHTNKDVTIQMTDGTNTETIFTADLTNQDLTLAHSIPHGWKGWKDARLEVISGSTKQVSVTLGYAKFPNADEFGVWDNNR